MHKLPTPPTVNHYYRRAGRRVFLSAEARAYRDEVAALLAGCEPLRGSVSVYVVWLRRRRRGDIDNILKPLLDALQGRLYVNDKQIVELGVRVEQADEDCVLVRVRRTLLAVPLLDEIGDVIDSIT